MSQKINDVKFYEALKNCQPIVFLASFSMIIAAFSFDNQQISGVYDNAVLASIMFLISFVFSMIDQLAPKSQNDADDTWLRGSKFFFFIIGVLYLILVAFEFSRPLPQTLFIILYWGVVAIGVSFFSIVFLKKGKFNPKLYNNKALRICIYGIGIVSSSSFIIVGSIAVGVIIFKIIVDTKILETLYFVLAVIGFGGIFVDTILIMINEKKRKSKAK